MYKMYDNSYASDGEDSEKLNGMLLYEWFGNDSKKLNVMLASTR